MERILQRYHVSPDARLGGGMEAQVYAYDHDRVLKIYTAAARLDQLLTLQSFYQSLDRTSLPYALPTILDVVDQEDCIVSIETRLTGKPMSETLRASLTEGQFDGLAHRYLDAALALTRIPLPAGQARYKLFDADHISDRSHGDWHRFLSAYLARQLADSGRYLARDVSSFARKLAKLQASLATPYTGPCCLIHGDFYPGNILLDAHSNVSAVIDFGLMTMFGDPLFDLALGWAFFDMYDELGINACGRYLSALLDKLGKSQWPALCRYRLIYSILGANAYSPTCSDGHYRWCVENLNTEAYWLY